MISDFLKDAGFAEKALVVVIVACVGFIGWTALRPKSKVVPIAKLVGMPVKTGSPMAVDGRLLAFLEHEALKDPAREIASAPLAHKIQGFLPKLKGRFRGTLHHAASGQRVSMTTAIGAVETRAGVVSLLQGELGDAKLTKKFKFLTTVRTVPRTQEREEAQIVQVGPGAYMQMFYIWKTDQWIANYYTQQPNGSIAYIGVAQLARY